MRILGDSISTNSTSSGATTAANSWAGKTTPLAVTQYKNNPADNWPGLVTPVNNAASGAQAAGMSTTVSGLAPDSEPVMAMIGTNDVRTYKNDALKQSYFKAFLLASVVWLLTPQKEKALVGGSPNPGFSYTGTWGGPAAFAWGRWTDTLGSKVSGSFNGDALYVFYARQDVLGDRIANVKVDGVLVGSVNCKGTGMSGYAQACDRFAGFGPGAHTFELEYVTGGNRFYFNGIADNDQVNPSKFLLSNIPYYSSAYYTAQGITQATTDAYNALIDGIINDLAADGFNIVKVDNNASIVPTTDLNADGVHPNNAGHVKLAANFHAAL